MESSANPSCCRGPGASVGYASARAAQASGDGRDLVGVADGDAVERA